MPLLLPLLEALAPLFKKRDTWYLLVILLLLLGVTMTTRRYEAAEAALAARPAVHTEAEQKTDTVSHKTQDKGRVRITETFAPAPAGQCPGAAPQLVSRTLERDPVVTTTVTETKKDSEVVKDVKPACPAAEPQPWRYAGVLVDPWQPSKVVGIRGGVTLWNRIDLGLGARLAPHAEGQAEVSIRF